MYGKIPMVLFFVPKVKSEKIIFCNRKSTDYIVVRLLKNEIIYENKNIWFESLKKSRTRLNKEIKNKKLFLYFYIQIKRH